jgi:phage baseplate assembly protein W
MTPTEPDNEIVAAAFTVQEMPGKTYKYDIDRNHIAGSTDKLDAMKQAIYLILSTERYVYPIYSWNYGVELANLIGMPTDYCLPEIKRRVTEALLTDDRISSVDNWTFDVNRQKVQATFTAHTIYGDVNSQTEVNI